MTNIDNAHFDEAYFQRGHDRGTAYCDYAKGADESLTFREVAQALNFVFQPKRSLEIGCATGAIVRNLSDLGVEAHGIDVSEWAVANRLHPNVSLAGAQDLPFESSSFDLIYSSHSLEHLPVPLVNKALAEIDRVASADALQFHMLPIIGTFPYDYDHDTARQNLRADPTHQVLEPMEWWRGKWEELGWATLDQNMQFYHDTNGGELSSGQYTLSKAGADRGTAARCFEWNRLVHRQQQQVIDREKASMAKPVPSATSFDSLSEKHGPSDNWCDFERCFEHSVCLEGATLNLLIEYQGQEVTPLRTALIDESDPAGRGVFEFWSQFSPGLSAVRIPVQDFRLLEGRPSFRNIDKIFFGGMLNGGSFRIAGALELKGGEVVSLIA